MTTVTATSPATMDEMQAEIDRLHEGHARIYDENAKLRKALEPFAAIDLLECRLPQEFAMHVLRARGALTPNAEITGRASVPFDVQCRVLCGVTKEIAA